MQDPTIAEHTSSQPQLRCASNTVPLICWLLTVADYCGARDTAPVVERVGEWSSIAFA
jgi:hypothetical protein